jgi:HAD superfamily phosphoserine phosphatase-like hydrolase
MSSQEKKLILIDFDYTLCVTESFDYYVTKYRSEYSEQCEELTKLLYKDRISFLELLNQKLTLLKPKKEHFQIGAVDIFFTTVDKEKLSFLKDIQQEYSTCVDIKIASGGIKDLLNHTACQGNLDVLSVELDYDENNSYRGIKDNGFQINKAEGLKRFLKENKYKKVLLIGDGMNDYEVYKAGLVDLFIHYTKFRKDGLKSVEEPYSEERGFVTSERFDEETESTYDILFSQIKQFITA